ECASCGERLHEPAREDAEHRRMLWCQRCKVWIDRDVNAVLNLSTRGRSRFDRSLLLSQPAGSRSQQVLLLAGKGEKGLAVEAVRGNQKTPAILRVDASKSGQMRRRPMVDSLGHHPKA
ncbi:MAG: transposase, partial [Nitrososphaerota archaeon]|nr:transposase [Nitrososphaerota archaeon]